MKHCKGCGTDKPLDAFAKANANKDGRQSRCRACRAAYVAANRAKENARIQAWSTANREHRRAYMQEWRAANHDKIQEYGQRWNSANPDVGRQSKLRRRARERSATVAVFTHLELKAYWVKLGLTDCVYCGGPYEHIDHVIPLARGGAHSLDNLVPACAACNLSKGAKLLEEWLPTRT